jgi:hypothetical protein
MADGVSYEGVGQPIIAGGTATFSAPSHKVMRRIYVRSADPAFILQQSQAGRGGAVAPTSNAAPKDYETKNSNQSSTKPLDKIDKSLLNKKGQVEIQLWVDDVTADILKALEAKGLKIADKDAKLKVIFGTCDASKLLEIAKVAEVQRIKPLSD